PYYVGGFDYAWKHAYLRKCVETSVTRAEAVIVPYHVTKAQLVSLVGVDPSKIHFVHYGVDHSCYRPQPAVEQPSARVLYCGEERCSTGVDVLIRAFSAVKRDVPDSELLVGGKPSKDQDALELLCRKLNVKDVLFAGFIPEDDLARHYATAAVMVFPS